MAVGADWTTNENILGYQDALQPDTYRKPSCGALDIILRADREMKMAKAGGSQPLPYFLILDEMNLSHVERYFADILSAIESGQEARRLAPAAPGGQDSPPPAEAAPFSPREQQVLELAATGLTNKEIAFRLGISDRTVQFHINSIFNKTATNSRTEAVAVALQRGWIPPARG